MENHHSSQSLPPTSEQIHQKQFIWQILLPILAVAVVVLSASILSIVAASAGSSQFTNWAMISTILMILPWLLFSLIPLALLILCIWSLRKTHTGLKHYLGSATVISDRMRVRTEGITRGATSPIIQIRSTKAGFVHLLRLAFRLDNLPKE